MLKTKDNKLLKCFATIQEKHIILDIKSSKEAEPEKPNSVKYKV